MKFHFLLPALIGFFLMSPPVFDGFTPNPSASLAQWDKGTGREYDFITCELVRERMVGHLSDRDDSWFIAVQQSITDQQHIYSTATLKLKIQESRCISSDDSRLTAATPPLRGHRYLEIQPERP